jgi:hypothetical protein
MPQFISKLQHKSYEKGEFSEEQERTLEETLSLIKTFPWDEERPLTDVQLTGPSVTIQNKNGEYLKVGLYFNGKFCLYFLNKGNHVYEYHAPDIDGACGFVSDYFNNQLDLQKFEKHLFDISANKHFENKDFDYTINLYDFYLRLILTTGLSLFIVTLTIFIIIKSPSLLIIVLFISLSFLTLIAPYITLKFYLRSKNMVLHISKGHEEFQFGDIDEVQTYLKSDITKISIYGSRNSKGSHSFNIIEIHFKDETQIEFPGWLIDPFLLESKFQNINLNFIQKSSTIRKRMWNFTSPAN